MKMPVEMKQGDQTQPQGVDGGGGGGAITSHGLVGTRRAGSSTDLSALVGQFYGVGLSRSLHSLKVNLILF